MKGKGWEATGRRKEWTRGIQVFVHMLTNQLLGLQFVAMPKQVKSEMLGKVYREFSRQKYNKYKAQFPRLRESQIVSKIIKEWDALDNVAKENLQKIYEKKNYLTNEDISSSEALAKADLASKEARVAAERSAKKSTKPAFSATRQHAIVKPASSQGSDFNRGSEQRDDSRLDTSSPQAQILKTRLIQKPTKSDYITFFKRQYQRLTREHKRWSTQQIAKVVKLLWKKQKGETKTLRRKDGKLRTSKPLSGRRYFRKVRHLSGSESASLWKHFPIETRVHWDNESKGIKIDNSKKFDAVKFTSSFEFQGLTKILRGQ